MSDLFGTDLFWPGDHRAGDHLTDRGFLRALLAVEAAWLDVLGVPGREQVTALGDLDGLELDLLAHEAEAGGNPVMSLVAELRSSLAARHPEAARWLHRGLTSQDVVDTALMVMLRDALAALDDDLRRLVRRMVQVVRDHADTPMVARTLTQHAVPTTFGLKAATWLTGLLDAREDLQALTFPVQLGGAAGTLAAVVEFGHDPFAARADLALRLGLRDLPAWHTTRRPVTRVADALVAVTDACGRVAGDVLVLSRPEIGELSEGIGGGSATMPHKANPVLATLVRRAALTTPQLGATLHLAAADQVDERGAGSWHAEWATLRVLTRRTLTAGSQTLDLLDELRVHPDRMAATLATARPDLLAEQRTMADLAGHDPTGHHLGAASRLSDAVLARAEESLR